MYNTTSLLVYRYCSVTYNYLSFGEYYIMSIKLYYMLICMLMYFCFTSICVFATYTSLSTAYIQIHSIGDHDHWRHGAGSGDGLDPRYDSGSGLHAQSVSTFMLLFTWVYVFYLFS